MRLRVWVLLQICSYMCHSTRDRIVGCVGFFCGSRIDVHDVDMRLGCVINSRVRVALRVPVCKEFFERNVD